MSIHIPQIFIHGHGHGHAHGSSNNTNYLVNKYASNLMEETSTKEMNFKFDEDTSSYFYKELSNILNKSNQSSNNEHHENIIVSNSSEHANDTNDATDNDDNICLITKDKLEPNHITLNCNHKFNYVPLYHEVVNQKNKQNNMYETTKLLTNEIKCPYCRAITYKLLPYIPYPSVKLIKNVNSYINGIYNNKQEYFLYAPKCGYTTSLIECQKYAVYYEKENILLCPQHYKSYLLKQKNSNKKLEKAEKGVAKGVAKDSKTDIESGCCAILKSGKNVGKKCGVVCFEGGDNGGETQNDSEVKYCKKHYKLYCKS